MIDTDWYAGGRANTFHKRVGIGDLIEILGDRTFFETTDRESPERHVGYVVSISIRNVGISSTHPKNKFQGYPETERKEPQVTNFEISHIGHYKIIRKDDEPIDTTNRR